MSPSLILLLILLLLLIGSAPAWPYSRNWGYTPAGGLGAVLLIVLVLVLLRLI
jgi:low affinity Fe/Cu permease